MGVIADTDGSFDKHLRQNLWRMAGCRFCHQMDFVRRCHNNEKDVQGEGLIVKSLLPVGTHWPMDARLRERASQEREVFRCWKADPEIPESQEQVLAELLELLDEREFVEGRAACVTYEAELARRTGLGDALQGVLADLKRADLLTCQQAAEVFQDNPPGMVLRIRHPDVVLTVEAAGLLWLKDSWLRQNVNGRS